VNRSSKIFAVDHTEESTGSPEKKQKKNKIPIRKVQLPGSFGIRCKNNSSWGWGLGSHFWHRLLLPKKTHKSAGREKSKAIPFSPMAEAILKKLIEFRVIGWKKCWFGGKTTTISLSRAWKQRGSLWRGAF